MKAAILPAFCMSIMLAGCNNDPKEKLYGYVSKNPTAQSGDVWLEKRIFSGEWDRTGLIFGYIDNYKFCSEIAEMYVKRYNLDQYRCTRAN